MANMEKELGCRLPFNIHFPSQHPNECATRKEYEAFLAMLTHYESITELGVAKETQCLPNCVQDEFELQVKHTMESPKSYADEEDIDLTISFTTTKYDYHKDISIYQEGSFVADVGGMMGLLLGASIYSMFIQCKERIHKMSKRNEKKAKQGRALSKKRSKRKADNCHQVQDLRVCEYHTSYEARNTTSQS